MKELIVILEKKNNSLLSKFLTLLANSKNISYHDMFIQLGRRSFYRTLEKVKKLERLFLNNFSGSFFEIEEEKIGKRKFRKNLRTVCEIELIDQNNSFELWVFKNE